MTTFEVFVPNVNTTTKTTFVQNAVDTSEFDQLSEYLQQFPKKDCNN